MAAENTPHWHDCPDCGTRHLTTYRFDCPDCFAAKHAAFWAAMGSDPVTIESIQERNTHHDHIRNREQGGR